MFSEIIRVPKNVPMNILGPLSLGPVPLWFLGDETLLEPPPAPRSKWDDSTTPAWMQVTRWLTGVLFFFLADPGN